MDLLGKVMDKVMDKAQGGGAGGGGQPAGGESYGAGGYPPNPGYSSGPPPPSGGDLPYPWISRWDDQSQQYYYINEQTGERTWEHPGSRGGGGYEQPPGSGYGGGGYGGGYDQGGYGGGEYGGYPPQEQEKPKKDHSMLYGAGGAALGLAGGALAMHEGEKMHDGWEDKKENLEEGVNDFPENAAHWTGETVGEAEQIPDNIEDGFDRFGNKIEDGWDDTVDNVQDFPENAAEWSGEKVGAVESFGDDMGDAYDAGEEDGRYND